MLHDQTVTFLEAVVVFLLLTNAVSVLITAYAIRCANVLNPRAARTMSAAERNIEAGLAPREATLAAATPGSALVLARRVLLNAEACSGL